MNGSRGRNNMSSSSSTTTTPTTAAAGAPPSDDANLNADPTHHVVMRTSQMTWTRSGPTALVERKRCFRYGPQESGAVTSLVRYLPHASFPSHPHPQGEEIFVLEGIFSDERGHHGPGTFLLNPEGFVHAPSTDEHGNLILVRLRQYPNAMPGVDRAQCALDTHQMAWIDVAERRGKGVSEKVLYPPPPNDAVDESKAKAQESYPERQWLERWDERAHPKAFQVGGCGLEVFVVDGQAASPSSSKGDGSGNGSERYEKGDWVRFPAGSTFDWTPSSHGPSTTTLLFKSGGLKYAFPTK